MWAKDKCVKCYPGVSVVVVVQTLGVAQQDVIAVSDLAVLRCDYLSTEQLNNTHFVPQVSLLKNNSVCDYVVKAFQNFERLHKSVWFECLSRCADRRWDNHQLRCKREEDRATCEESSVQFSQQAVCILQNGARNEICHIKCFILKCVQCVCIDKCAGSISNDLNYWMRRGPQLGHLCSDGCRGKYAAVSDKVSSVRLEASSLSELCLVVCSSQQKWNWPYWKGTMHALNNVLT